MKKTTEVAIMGQKFMVKSDSNEDYVRRIADFVNEKIVEVMETTNSVASLNVAILAAMNIADEFFKYQNDREQKIGTVEKKVQDLIELIDLQL